MKFPLAFLAIPLAFIIQQGAFAQIFNPYLKLRAPRADFEFAAFTSKGEMIEIQTDTVISYDDGTVKFLARRRYMSSIVGADIIVADCFNRNRVMFVSRYNPNSKSWIDNPNPEWWSTMNSPITSFVATKACAYR